MKMVSLKTELYIFQFVRHVLYKYMFLMSTDPNYYKYTIIKKR